MIYKQIVIALCSISLGSVISYGIYKFKEDNKKILLKIENDMIQEKNESDYEEIEIPEE